jgi:hypothetical protein
MIVPESSSPASSSAASSGTSTHLRLTAGRSSLEHELERAGRFTNDRHESNAGRRIEVGAKLAFESGVKLSSQRNLEAFAGPVSEKHA